MPSFVERYSISEILALPFSGITAPDNATEEPSAENLIPYAVHPLGFNSLDAQFIQISSGIA